MLFSLTACGVKNDNIQSAMDLINEHEYEQALSVLSQAQEAGENLRLIDRGRGIAYLGLAKYEDAISAFTNSLQLSNGIVENIDYDINYYMAVCYQKIGDFDAAKCRYDAIIDLDSKAVDAYFFRGLCLLELNIFQDAKADFDKVYQMDKKNYDRIIEIYQVFAEHGYVNNGEEYLRDIISNDSDKMSKYDLGRILYFLGDYNQAAVALEQAREKLNPDSYLYLGLAYEATGDCNYAASVYNSYLAKDSSNAKLYNQLGICEMKRGNYQLALEAFQSGIKLDNDSVERDLLFNEIVAYEYLGDFETARHKMNNYIKVYPDDKVALREQVFLKTR